MNYKQKTQTKKRIKYSLIFTYVSLFSMLLSLVLIAELNPKIYYQLFFVISVIFAVLGTITNLVNDFKLNRFKQEIISQRQNFAAHKIFNYLLNDNYQEAVRTYNLIRKNSYITSELRNTLYTALLFYGLNIKDKKEGSEKRIRDILETNFS